MEGFKCPVSGSLNRHAGAGSGIMLAKQGSQPLFWMK